MTFLRPRNRRSLILRFLAAYESDVLIQSSCASKLSSNATGPLKIPALNLKDIPARSTAINRGNPKHSESSFLISHLNPVLSYPVLATRACYSFLLKRASTANSFRYFLIGRAGVPQKTIPFPRITFLLGMPL